MYTPNKTTDYADYFLVEPNIILIRFKRDTDLDESIAIDILSNLISLTNNNYHGLIYDMNNKNIIIREVTRKLSSVRDEKTSKLICRALIVTSLQNKLEGTHYIQTGNLQASTQKFGTYEEALIWTKEKLKNY